MWSLWKIQEFHHLGWQIPQSLFSGSFNCDLRINHIFTFQNNIHDMDCILIYLRKILLQMINHFKRARTSNRTEQISRKRKSEKPNFHWTLGQKDSKEQIYCSFSILNRYFSTYRHFRNLPHTARIHLIR